MISQCGTESKVVQAQYKGSHLQPVMGMRKMWLTKTARPIGSGARFCLPGRATSGFEYTSSVVTAFVLTALSSTVYMSRAVPITSARRAPPADTDEFWKPLAPSPPERSSTVGELEVTAARMPAPAIEPSS